MDRNFWLERWERREIAFHRALPHPKLVAHWRAVARPGDRVFVPLAGKSLDMVWLRERGHEVVAVELSEAAVREFFAEHALTPQVEERDAFRRFTAEGIDVWCGDFFSLTRDHLGAFDAVFDRAALVALPPATREAYAARMAALSSPGTRTLLVTLEYDQAEMRGPPFSVPEAEVRRLYGTTNDVRLLARSDAPEDAPRLAARGVTRLAEAAYALERA